MSLLVFASGCAALVFQIAWMRDLRLVFGATTAAVSAVLAVFMAGLGVGSAILGPRADRVDKPLAFYGYLEIAIALAVAVSPWLVTLASAIYIGVGGQQALGVGGATAVRLLLTVVIMGVPTFLMGGTLPAAVRAVTRVTDEHRGALGVLYGANTLGAVCGALVASFYAIELLGTRATLWAGCALGLAAGALAVLRARRLAPLPKSPTVPTTAPQADQSSHNGAVRPYFIYATAAILGFTFFALELVWYRMLGPILGGTTFTFGLILCVALLGIGIGGVAYNFIFRRWRPTWEALAITCGLEAAFTIAPFALGDRLAMLAARQAQSAITFFELTSGWALVAAIVVLPAAIVSGVQFPLMTALLGQARQTVSRHLGMTYAWNTLGAITGSLVGGFGALPLLSAPGLWQVLALLLGALSLGVLVMAPRTTTQESKDPNTQVPKRDSPVAPGLFAQGAATTVVALVVLTVFGTFTTGPTAVWRHGGVGAGRAEVDLAHPNRVRQWQHEKRRTLIWETDGIESSIGIDAPNGLSFVVNGKSDGNSLSDAPTQIGVSILAAALHPDPRTGMVIGLGTGESAGWLAEMRSIERVDVVELEPAIDEMADRCRELNFDVLNHPRVRRIYNDGREFVLTTNETYDVLLSEPSNPYRAGVASLYTQEFYRAVQSRLNPGGLFIQWLQAYEIDVATIATVLATARSVFDHIEVWQTLAGDLQLVCAAEEIVHSADELRARIEHPTVKKALAQAWHVHDLEGFLAHFAGGPAWADYLAQQPHVALNTDDRTVLEYRFAKMVGRETPFSLEIARSEFRAPWRQLPLGDETIDWTRIELRRQEFNLLLGWQLSIALLPKAEDRQLVEALDLFRANDFVGSVENWPASHLPPSTDVQRLVLARCYAELSRDDCLELIGAVTERYPTDAAALRATYQWRAGNVAEAEQALIEFYTRLKQDPWLIPIISETALSRTIDVARADRAAAQRFFDVYAAPFASWRLDQARALGRVMLGEVLGPERVVEALRDLEPHTPWTAELLKARAEAYAAVGHPLAKQAARDLRVFEKQELASPSQLAP